MEHNFKHAAPSTPPVEAYLVCVIGSRIDFEVVFPLRMNVSIKMCSTKDQVAKGTLERMLVGSSQ